VSADFRNHSAAFLFGPILKRHDRTAIEVVCYSDVRRPDDRTREFERIADRWLTVRHLSDEALADQVRADGIDLLVDLAGHSAGNRLRTFALKPAPVQLTGWGYGAGTGVPTIDYLMSDPVQIPPTVRPYFAERILDLPCFIPFEPPAYAPDVQELPAFKTGAVTFGCFNQFVKVSDGMLGLWAQILREVPRSRLMLKDPALDDPSARAFALRALAANGIETSRVKLMGRTAHREHLDAYRNIDIALDPSPYGGGVTTWEALWMGCPVVTNIGRNAASTGTAAILFAIGLAGWTAENNDDYAALAIRGAADVRALAVIRAKLRTTIKASEAGNPDLYVRAVDAAFRDVWRKWCEEG
jgi:predicted O-linked N-acetylglucosamine transferase (SPINDLY family)